MIKSGYEREITGKKKRREGTTRDSKEGMRRDGKNRLEESERGRWREEQGRREEK